MGQREERIRGGCPRSGIGRASGGDERVERPRVRGDVRLGLGVEAEVAEQEERLERRNRELRLKHGIFRRVGGEPGQLEDDVDVVILVVVYPVSRDARRGENLQDELHELAAARAEHLASAVVAPAARHVRQRANSRNLPLRVPLTNRRRELLHRLGEKLRAQKPPPGVGLARERREGRERQSRRRRRAGVAKGEAEHALGERDGLAPVARVDILDAHPLGVVVASHQVRG